MLQWRKSPWKSGSLLTLRGNHRAGRNAQNHFFGMVGAGERRQAARIAQLGFEYLDRNEAAPLFHALAAHHDRGVTVDERRNVRARWRITAEGVTITTADAPESTSSNSSMPSRGNQSYSQ